MHTDCLMTALKPGLIVGHVRDIATMDNTPVPLRMVLPLSVGLFYHKQCYHLLVISKIDVDSGSI